MSLYYGKYVSVILKALISAEFSSGYFQIEGVGIPAFVVSGLLVGSGSFFLSLHVYLEAFFICGISVVCQDLLGELQRESVGVVKLEYLIAVKDLGSGLHHIIDVFLYDLLALVQSLVEVILFHLDDLLDVILLLDQLGISFSGNCDDSVGKFLQEGSFDTQKSAMTGCTSQDSP